MRDSVYRGEECFIIAEIGNTHEGSLELAKCFIESASESGANAVKFQTHIFETESLPNAPNPPYFKGESRKKYFDKTGFSQEDWAELRKYATEECSIGFLSSPFSLEALQVLEEINLDAYKIASGEVTNLPLLTAIARTNKKVFLSSGMSSWNELDDAVNTLLENGCTELTIMQCTSEYPCPPERAGLNLIAEMKARYKLPVGFSDHTLGIAIPLAAVVLGATTIEKHFTLSKAMYGPDASLAATPDEFSVLSHHIRQIEKSLGHKIDKDGLVNALADMKLIFEKSIVSACHIPVGTVINEEHLAYKKPGDGIPPQQWRNVIGKRSNRDIQSKTQLTWEMID